MDSETDMEGLDGLLQKMRRKEIKRSIKERKGQARDKFKGNRQMKQIEGVEEARKEERKRMSSLNDEGKIEEEEESAIDINIIDNSPR